MRWLDSTQGLERLSSREQRKQFLLNLICFAACIEGLFFFGAFAYVYFLRSRGLLHGLAAGTNWVFRDESAHMAFAFEAVNTIRSEEPELFDEDLTRADPTTCSRTPFPAKRSSPRICSGRVGRSLRARCAALPRVLRRPAARDAASAEALRGQESIFLHGSAGRSRGDELLRTPRVGLQMGVTGEVVLDAAF